MVAWLPSCSAEHSTEREVAQHSKLCVTSVIVSRSPSIPEPLPVADQVTVALLCEPCTPLPGVPGAF